MGNPLPLFLTLTGISWAVKLPAAQAASQSNGTRTSGIGPGLGIFSKCARTLPCATRVENITPGVFEGQLTSNYLEGREKRGREWETKVMRARVGG